MITSIFNRSRSSPGAARGVLSELERLDIIHALHLTLLEPYHSTLIGTHLASIHTTGRRSRVLDVGTGTGAWAVNIANSQPFADVVGIDTEWAAFHNSTARNGNIDFATVDVKRPLPYPANSFDVIHVKSLVLEVPEYNRLVERLAMILRPGGLLVLVEAENQFRETGGGETSLALRTWDASVRSAYASRGIDVDIPGDLLTTLAMSGVFSPQVYVQELGMPTAGFNRSDAKTLAQIGRLHSSVIHANLRGMIPTLLHHGYAEAQLEQLIEACMRELSSPTSQSYQKLFAVYATKMGG